MSQVGHQTARALLRRLAVEQAECADPVAGGPRSCATARSRGSAGRGRVDGASAGARHPVPDRFDHQEHRGRHRGHAAARRGPVDLLDPLGKHLPGTRFGEVTDRPVALAHRRPDAPSRPTGWWERTPGMPVADLLVPRRPRRAQAPAGPPLPLLQPRLRPARRAGRPAARHAVGAGGASRGPAARSAWPAPPPGRAPRTPPATPSTRGPTCCCPSPSTTPAPWPRPGSCGPPPPTWPAGRRSSPGTPAACCRPATLAEMREPATVDDGDAWTSGYGLGLQLTRHARAPPGRPHRLHARLPGHRVGRPRRRRRRAVHGQHHLRPATRACSPTCSTSSTSTSRACPQEWTPAGADPALLALTGLWHWGPAPYALRLLPRRRPVARTGRAAPGAPPGSSPQDDGTWLGLDGYYAGETLRVPPADHLDLNTFVFTRDPYDPAAPVPGGVDDWH